MSTNTIAASRGIGVHRRTRGRAGCSADIDLPAISATPVPSSRCPAEKRLSRSHISTSAAVSTG